MYRMLSTQKAPNKYELPSRQKLLSVSRGELPCFNSATHSDGSIRYKGQEASRHTRFEESVLLASLKFERGK
jgi:hypothetical protein